MFKLRLSFYPISLAGWVILLYMALTGMSTIWWLIPLLVIFLERLYVQTIILIVGRAISQTTKRFADAMEQAGSGLGGPLG
jgi:hypothetical protein